MSVDVEFSRHYLTLVHKDVKRVPGLKGNVWKLAWVYKYGRDVYEFHGPDKYYTTISATDAFDARAKGWGYYIQNRHPELHAILEKEAEEEAANESQGPR